MTILKIVKGIIRHYIIDTSSLFVVSQIASGIVFEKGLTTILLAGVGVTTSTIIVKPIINILILPINLVTFGLFKWVSSAIALYLVTLLVPGFKIISFNFPGLTTPWIDIPTFALSGAFAFIAFSFLLSFVTSFVYWLIK